jgi:hypothetical protein
MGKNEKSRLNKSRDLDRDRKLLAAFLNSNANGHTDHGVIAVG